MQNMLLGAEYSQSTNTYCRRNYSFRLKRHVLHSQQLIWMMLHHRVEFSLQELIFILSLSLLFINCCSRFQCIHYGLLSIQQWPSSQRQINTTPCGMTYQKDNYISGKWDIALHFRHLADALIKSDLQWVHGSNKIKFQGRERFKQQKWVDEPKPQHSDNRY